MGARRSCRDPFDRGFPDRPFRAVVREAVTGAVRDAVNASQLDGGGSRFVGVNVIIQATDLHDKTELRRALNGLDEVVKRAMPTGRSTFTTEAVPIRSGPGKSAPDRRADTPPTKRGDDGGRGSLGVLRELHPKIVKNGFPALGTATLGPLQRALSRDHNPLAHASAGPPRGPSGRSDRTRSRGDTKAPSPHR